MFLISIVFYLVSKRWTCSLHLEECHEEFIALILTLRVGCGSGFKYSVFVSYSDLCDWGWVPWNWTRPEQFVCLFLMTRLTKLTKVRKKSLKLRQIWYNGKKLTKYSKLCHLWYNEIKVDITTLQMPQPQSNTFFPFTL